MYMTRKEITVLALWMWCRRRKRCCEQKNVSTLICEVCTVSQSLYVVVVVLFFLLSRDIQLMKAPAVAFMREHFHVSMFWGEHLHVLYTLNE